MAIKVKEMKDDAIVEIKVNKSFYLMAKAASFTILNTMNIQEKNEEYLKKLMNSTYEELEPVERTFYTIILLLAEIEKQATEANLYNEKEVLEPGDPGYVAPTED